MSPLAKRLLWIGLGLSVLLSAVWEWFPLPDAQERVKGMAKAGVGYSSQDLALTPTESAGFEGASVQKRLYQIGEQRFVVAVVDGARNRHAVHDPLFCIRGSGWRIVRQSSFPIQGGEALWLRVVKSGQETELLVWFSDGKHRHASPGRYWWQTTLRRVTLGNSGPEPVLVLIQPAEKGTWNWRQMADGCSALFSF